MNPLGYAHPQTSNATAAVQAPCKRRVRQAAWPFPTAGLSTVNTDQHKLDVAIIGGGAAGLFCAITAAQRGRRVGVFEHANRVGKKILMSGGGRCNFTNLHASPDQFLSANPHYCRSALARYTQWDFIALVEKHGIAYHEKERGQLFCDISSKLIVKMLLDECAAADVRIETGCAVSAIHRTDGGYTLATAIGQISAESLVVATGGLSIPKMGASGFGYDIAKQFGHTVLPTRAGLVPITLSGQPQEDFDGLAGVSTECVAASPSQQFDGPVLITHRGLSGPAILQVSSYWTASEALTINWLPQADGEQFWQSQRDAQPSALPSQVLAQHMPQRLAQRICDLAGWNHPLQQIGRKQLAAMGQQLNRWPITASGTEGYRTAEVTLGGVDTRELSSRTMESAKLPNLYFIGEVVDVTGWLGGYNFQWAWSSGYAAGMAV